MSRIFFGSSAPSGNTADVGLATETDSALALARAKQRTEGLAAETDSAVALAGAKQRAAGVATETDSSLALTGAKQRVVGVATETGSALSLPRQKIRSVGLAVETSSAPAIAGSKQRPVGLANETDEARALASSRVGTALEADSALPLGRSKQRPVGLAVETESALALGGQHQRPVGLATETSSAIALSRAKQRAAGVATESDAALATGRQKQRPVGVAEETDQALGSGVPIGTATETDTALSLPRSKRRSVGLAESSDLALALARSKQRAVGLATETDESPQFITQFGDVGLALEVDQALALHGSKRRPVGVALETNEALSPPRSKQRPVQHREYVPDYAPAERWLSANAQLGGWMLDAATAVVAALRTHLMAALRDEIKQAAGGDAASPGELAANVLEGWGPPETELIYPSIVIDVPAPGDYVSTAPVMVNRVDSVTPTNPNFTGYFSLGSMVLPVTLEVVADSVASRAQVLQAIELALGYALVDEEGVLRLVATEYYDALVAVWLDGTPRFADGASGTGASEWRAIVSLQAEVEHIVPMQGKRMLTLETDTTVCIEHAIPTPAAERRTVFEPA